MRLPEPVRSLATRVTPRNVLVTAVIASLAFTGYLAVRYASVRATDTWEVGELRPDGLRIVPSGRSDGSAVLDPAEFRDPRTRHAYWIATQIPEVMNQLYCWCGCENSGQHRSSLACFEDRMGEDCDICQETAEIALSMVQQGSRQPATIQAALDRKWGP